MNLQVWIWGACLEDLCSQLTDSTAKFIDKVGFNEKRKKHTAVSSYQKRSAMKMTKTGKRYSRGT